MQEAMLASLKKHVQALLEVPERADWKPELALALLQGCAAGERARHKLRPGREFSVG